MRGELERFFQEFNKAKEQDFKSEEELQNFLDDFTQQYNAHIDEKRAYDAYDYLEMAEYALDDKEAICYAKKALKLDPHFLDADLFIMQTKSNSLAELQKNLEKLIKKGEEQLSVQGISKEQDAGIFYGLLETRPYMRVRSEYVEVLLAQGKFRLAISELEELLILNDKDNLGLRYMLMALYAYFEEEENATALYKKYPEDSAFMLLPLIALYYKMGKTRKMRNNIRKLKQSNPHVLEALELIGGKGDEDELESIFSAEYYRPFSVEEVVLAILQIPFLYMPLSEFLDRLYDEVMEN